MRNQLGMVWQKKLCITHFSAKSQIHMQHLAFKGEHANLFIFMLDSGT